MVEPIHYVIVDMDHTLLESATFNSFAYAAEVDKAAWDAIKAECRYSPDRAEEWGRRNAEMLRGKRVADIWASYGRIEYALGVKRFFRELPPEIKKTGIITSSIDVFAQRVAQELGIDFFVANELVVNDGVITGDYNLNVSMYNKLEVFLREMERRGIPLKNVLFVGDNENDLEVMSEVSGAGGYSAAYKPYRCPRLTEIADLPEFDDYSLLTRIILRRNEDAAKSGLLNVDRREQKIVPSLGILISDREGRVALVRENEEDDKWEIPTTSYELAEDYKEVAVREASEKTNLAVEVIGLTGQYTSRGDAGELIIRNNVVAVTVGSPDYYEIMPSARSNVAAAEWHNLENILKNRPSNVPAHVLQQLEHLRGNILPTFFIGKHLTKDDPPPGVKSANEQNIILTVGVLICAGDRVVLIREGRRGAMWNIPGGKLEPGESYREAAIREAREETDLEVIPLGFIGEYVRRGDRGDWIIKKNLLAVTDGSLLNYRPHPRDLSDVIAAEWFDLRDLIEDNPVNVPPYVRTQLIDLSRRKPAPLPFITRQLEISRQPEGEPQIPFEIKTISSPGEVRRRWVPDDESEGDDTDGKKR